MSKPRRQNRYDHRLQDLVRNTGDIHVATRVGVPRSTASGWLRKESIPVISADVSSRTKKDLEAEVLKLREKLRLLTVLLRAVVALVKATGLDLVRTRIPDSADKRRIMRAVERASNSRERRRILKLIGLSSARYHSWQRSELGCELDDQSSCPSSVPSRLTTDEITEIREMATSPEYRHVPTGTLAILAQRLGRVFASPTTWYKLVRERNWRRPRLRVHPAKPKVGIRARKPDEMWHIDMTLIRLLDGTKAYLHAVIDNYSRRILGWRIANSFDPGNTIAVLRDASKDSENKNDIPTVMTDAGVENVNKDVDELIDSGFLKRVIAQTELNFSNSMIEAWWRVLKHQWLYLNSLESVSKVEQLVRFYVEEHNSHLPHTALKGQTPDEMYFGSGEAIPEELQKRRRQAQIERLEQNRALSCGICQEGFVAV